jgi:DNA repair protein RadA/Sms
VARTAPGVAALPITDVDTVEARAVSTGMAEVDRVLGGGLSPGSVSLIGGEPGIGKSTLLLQIAAALARAGLRVLYVTAEESPQQVRLRADRVRALDAGLHLAAEADLSRILAHLDQVAPQVLVVDSMQTIHDPALGSAPGSVAQVRDCAAALVAEARGRHITTVFVGHITKDGALAGPKVVEHLVDTVVMFEGDRHQELRLLRLQKHRYGATSELGVFRMTHEGLVSVDDPSGLFLADRRADTPGSIVVPLLEGTRPVLVEVQALVAPTQVPSPRRSAHGVDPGRLPLLLAVLERRLGLPLGRHDVFCSVAGGIRAHEPGADLAVALAVVSAAAERPLPFDTVAVGEVGLGGELRQVSQLDRRLVEAARLGYRRAIVPDAALDARGSEHVRAETIVDAARAVGLYPLLRAA